MADHSLSKNFEFKITDQWGGYNSANDRTNLPPNIITPPSLNVYKKLNGNWGNRPGQKRIGAANSTASAVSSEFVWNTSWGATYILAVADSKLWVIADNIWYQLLGSLTKTRYVFDKWWNDTDKKDECLFVNGTDDMFMWAGGFGLVAGTTANTIVLDRTIVASVLPSASGTVIGNGTTYTYTGSAGSTLTGVTPDPSGLAVGTGILETVVTSSNKPASGFLSDFLKVINNQVYVGSYTSRLCYISDDEDYTDYTVPTPRVPGSPELLTLDSTLNGIGVRNGKAYIAIGSGEWAIVNFNDITVGTTLTQQTVVDVKPTAKLAGAYAHEFIGNDGDNIVYLSQDQQLRTFGDFNNSFVAAYPSLSQQIATELEAENFSGGGLKCIADFTYITAPSSGKTYLYQVRQSVDSQNQVVVERLWHAPFVWNATRIDEVNGIVVAFSNANPQYYQVWNTDQFYDDSPSDEELPYTSILAPAYYTGSRRQGLITFDKVFSEGYLTPGTELFGTINYDYLGSTASITFPINTIMRPAKLFTLSVGSLGDTPLGDNPLGDELDTGSSVEELPKFKNINSVTTLSSFEYQMVYTSEAVNSQWEILAYGTNVHLEELEDSGFLINKAPIT